MCWSLAGGGGGGGGVVWYQIFATSRRGHIQIFVMRVASRLRILMKDKSQEKKRKRKAGCLVYAGMYCLSAYLLPDMYIEFYLIN
jgi:hypothetical protein